MYLENLSAILATTGGILRIFTKLTTLNDSNEYMTM